MKKILIIGGGSIGKRHLQNLLSLGEKEINVVETNPQRALEISKEYGVLTFSTVAEVEEKNFDIVFVCAPPVYHFENALRFANKGCNLFIEKPLSHNVDNVDNLLRVIKEKKLVTMVGSNWKFYPLFKKMKELLDTKAIGKILSARCQFGQYLPDWHPWEDYRRGYSANQKLGGGILLDSHEFDYLTWFIGDTVKKIVCFSAKNSDLEIDVEDTAEVILQFTTGTIAEIHLDYTQRFYQRNFEFFGETGTIIWSADQKKVVLKNKESGETIFPLEENYEVNIMYVEEIKHFLECIDKGVETVTPVAKAGEVLRLICAAKESAKNIQVISLI